MNSKQIVGLIKNGVIYSTCTRGIWLMLLGIIAIKPAIGQSFDEWITKVNTTTKSMDNMEMTINVKALNLGDMSTFYETKFFVIKQKNIIYYKMQDTEMLNDGYYNLIIHHEMKTVNLFRADDEHLSPAPEIMSLDSIMSYYSDAVVLSENSQVISYEVKQNNSVVPKVELTIDKQKQQVKKIAYNYKMGQDNEVDNRVEIQFTAKALTSSNRPLLDIERYIINSENKVALTDRFKGYQLYTLD